MQRSILTLSPLLPFLSFFVSATVADISASYIGRYLGWSFDYGAYPTLRFGLISLVWWSYPYLVGKALGQLAGINAHKKVAVVFPLAILLNFFSVYLTETMGLLWYIVWITVLGNIFFVGDMFAFPARMLKSAEMQRSARFAEHWAEWILFMLWPLTVWWLQKRLAEVSRRDLKGISQDRDVHAEML